MVANAAARDLFGIPEGAAAKAILGGVDAAGIPFRLEEVVKGDRPRGDLRIGDRRFTSSARPLPRNRPGVLWTFLDVTAQRAAEQERARAKHAAAVAQVSGSVAHDLINLLARIICRAENLQAPGAAPEVEAGAEALITEAEGAADVVRRLATYADTSIATVEAVDLGDLIAQWRDARSADESIRIVDVTGGRVMVDADLFRAVLYELEANARRAGAAQVMISQPPSPEKEAVLIQVEDDGPGMSSDTLVRAASPFFTTRPTDEASGLGLTMARSLMARFGGTLTLSSPPGKGMTVTLHLRRAPTAQRSMRA
ncbi:MULTISPECIES: ATP-binding protein [unclassified Brevundimonas]|uniref:ATP-binding protein n=1 Tax=unclassified Brevundimonas TaxID=2622653 RepID=UPI003F939D97